MVRLISLGSSFAAGPGIAPQIDVDAGRSSNNYPNYFARKLGLNPHDPDEFLDLTVSGATMLNLISEPQNTGKKVFPPQLDLLPSLKEGEDSSDVIITITGGGNDMFYIGSMFGLTLKNTLWGKLVMRFLMGKEEKEQLEHPTIASPEEISDRFKTLLDRLEEKYPHATVYLVEYFAMCSTDTRGGQDVAWDQTQVAKYIQQADLLQSLYAKAAQGRHNVHIIPLAQASAPHALGSPNPWVSNGSILNFFHRCAFHPNLLGMQNAANLLFDLHQTKSPPR